MFLLLLFFSIFQFSLTAGFDAAAAAADAGGGGGEKEGIELSSSLLLPSTLILMMMDPKEASFSKRYHGGTG